MQQIVTPADTNIKSNLYTIIPDIGLCESDLYTHHAIYPPLPPPAPDTYAENTFQSIFYNSSDASKALPKSALYKTELCKRFTEFGNCRYGVKCQFAHGPAELRQVLRHPKYKTTRCKSFWGSGHCPYGTRCRFIHEDSEEFSGFATTSSPYITIGNEVLAQSKDVSLNEVDTFNNAIWRSDTLMSLSSYTQQTCDALSDSALTAASSDEEDTFFPDLEDAINAVIQCSVSESGSEVENGWNQSEWLDSEWGRDASEDQLINTTEMSLPNETRTESSARLRIFERFH